MNMPYLTETGISIHAPARGATHRACRRGREALHFNPRSREGSDSKFAQILFMMYSNTNLQFLYYFTSANLPAFLCVLRIRTSRS